MRRKFPLDGRLMLLKVAGNLGVADTQQCLDAVNSFSGLTEPDLFLRGEVLVQQLLR